jgi:hypothetical protein
LCRSLYDNGKETWRRKYNKELQEEIEIAPLVRVSLEDKESNSLNSCSGAVRII